MSKHYMFNFLLKPWKGVKGGSLLIMRWNNNECRIKKDGSEQDEQ